MNIGEFRYAYPLHYPFSRPNVKIAKLFGLCKFMMTHKIIPYNEKVNPTLSVAMQFSAMSRLLTATVCYEYVYPLDYKVVRYMKKGIMPIASTTVDYENLLQGSLASKEEELDSIKNEEFKHSLHLCLEGVRTVIDNVRNITLAKNDVRSSLLRTYFDRMLDKPCETFDEAIQLRQRWQA